MLTKQTKAFKRYVKPITDKNKVAYKYNDSGFYFVEQRPLFWSEFYPVLTSSSLSTSIDFNVLIEKHFYIFNNLDNLILNENFYFSDVFEKFEYSDYAELPNEDRSLHSLHKHLNVKISHSTLFLPKALGFIRRIPVYMFRKKLLSNFLISSTLPKYNVVENLPLSVKIFWKLLNNFSSKNLPLTNYGTFSENMMGRLDKFNLNMDSVECDDYVLRLYDNYSSIEFIKNSSTLTNKFVLDYESDKTKIDTSYSYHPSTSSTNFMYDEINYNNNFLYFHYLSFNNFFDIWKDTNIYNYKNSKNILNANTNETLIKKNQADNVVVYPSVQASIITSCLTPPHPYNPTNGFLNVKNYVYTVLNVIFKKINPSKKSQTWLNNTEGFKITSKPKNVYFSSKNSSITFNSENLFNIDHYSAVYIDTVEETVYNIISKSNSSFIIQHLGLFLHFKLFWFKPKFEGFKFRFKKKIFSFYKTNEIKKTLMENRKSLFIFKYIDDRDIALNKRGELGYSNPNCTLNLDFFLKKKLELRSFASLKFKRTSYISNLFGYDRSTTELEYPDSIKNPNLDPKYQTDFRIPRIRFNPGYQRLWREHRLALANAIRFKYIYQRQLTRYLVRFYSYLKSYNILALEYKIWKIIIYSRLLPDLHSIKDFMDNSLIFFNGTVLRDEGDIMAVNDIVQIQVSFWYYIYYKWLMSWNNLRIKKFKKLVYRKKIASSYTIIKSLKQKSRYTPSYIYNMRFDMSDTKSYLEIDYFTLSFIFIYDSFIFDFISPDDFPEMKHYVYKLYNWKYIN